MVDSGPLHPESVIDLTRRRGFRAAAPKAATTAGPAPESGTFPLTLPFLLERLDDRSDQVKMWAAYQLVDRWQADAGQFLERMWNAPLAEIWESAIHLISKYRYHHYAFPLLRIFSSDERGLRAPAGLALGHLNYEPAAKPMQEWFFRVYRSQEANLAELQAAAKGLLLLDNLRFWEELYALLAECHQNHSIYSVLFNTLAAHAEQPHQVERLARAYGEPREFFHDFYLTQHLVEMVGSPTLSRYLQSRVNGRYSLPAAYQEALPLLGVEPAEGEVRDLVEALAGCTKSRAGLEQLVPLARALVDKLAPDEPESALIRAFLDGSEGWIKNWEEAILKVREVEYHLLVSLPLVALQAKAERECLADPRGEALRIIRIYQSPLLGPTFMLRVLSLLSSREGEPVMASLRGSPLSGWLRDEEKDALWKLMTRQLDGVDYPFEQILPEPWNYGNPAVLARLGEVLRERLPQYLHSGRNQAVDYCLAIFRRIATPNVLHLLVSHFDTLINHHYHAFVEAMTHVPDVRFLRPLLLHYREGEFEMERLIRFICDVHHVAYPAEVRPAAEKPQSAGAPSTVRLTCLACQMAYHYPLDALYVDEERIEQRQIPSPQDLWCPEPIQCKNCRAEVPLEPEQGFLGDLYTELVTARILHVTNKEESVLNHLHLIPFPVLEGKTCHPTEFLQRVERALAITTTPGEEVPYLIELGKFYLETGDLELARQAFQRVQSGPVKAPISLYYLGIIAFQEKNPYDARVYFSRLVETCTRDDFERELDNPVDMSRHYLKLLEKRDFKRSHFRLISS